MPTIAYIERTKRWRLRHPERAKQTQSRYKSSPKGLATESRYLSSPAARILRAMYWRENRLWNRLRMQENRRCG